MLKPSRLALLLAPLALGATLAAQTLEDALRLGEVSALGTARSLATGNSMSALGADWTAVGSNPAGLAAFRRNEFTLTTAGLFAGSRDARLNDGPTTGSSTDPRLALPQVALVIATRPIASRWKQLNFGIGVTQSARFEESLTYAGRSAGSITDKWLDEANLYGLDALGRRAYVDVSGNGDFDFVFNPLGLDQLSAFSTGLAFDAGVLIPGDNSSNPPFYNTDYDLARGDDIYGPGPELQKSGSFRRRGRNAGFDLSFGGNFDERLFVGATASLSRAEFRSTTVYRESDQDNLVPIYERLNYSELLNYSARGISGRVGIIYRVAQALRLGLSYHSPNRISVDDTFNAELTYVYRDQDGASVNGIAAPEQASVLEYVFVSPSQYRASLAGLFGQRGFVSAEVGYLNYAGSRFRFDGEDEAEAAINGLISDSLQGAFQLRIGGEVKVLPAVALRVGFQRFGAPRGDESASTALSAGLGYRYNRLSLDGAYQVTRRPDRQFTPYGVEPVNFPQPVVDYTPTSQVVALTLGWKLVRGE